MKIDDKYKWLARDESGYLCSHVKKPEKGKFNWHSGSQYELVEETNNSYSFIKWEDEEPTKISILGNIRASKFFEERNKKETINKPSHYIGVNGMEVEEVLENFLPKIKDGYVAHRVGSAIEYLLRHPEKNGDEDIMKAEQNIKQIADYNERKLIEPEDLQQESELSTFLRSLSDMQRGTDWVNYFVPNEVNTYRGGTNEND